ncbi:Alpha/beta hydrolase fold-1 [Ophiocordyceps camponoti-floridani]|uniref:Alpha/beta hydrolase fold-1 n=1 Tax=Ophiocordyceps camponoti-floridani TaxID=2030778 RepID=A0A8H4VAN6_9HYPO|nr:Alpha/beta hydrolase fold-1 [Ophiocordyceps camponoti-floridani]
MRSLFLYLAASTVFHATAYSADEKPKDPAKKYPGENISWTPCGNTTEGTPLECSDIDVPADQFAPKNQTSKLKFNIPLIRLRSKNGTKNLLFNPGGPGASGVENTIKVGDGIFNATGRDYHILSFDPRGVKGSEPNASCSSLTQPEPSSPFTIGDAKLYAWATTWGKSCADIMGEHGKFINTPQTAADMNSILDAVGQSDMYYLGVSYGSLLGQTYASLFPNRSARVIIDSVAHLSEYYESKVETANYNFTAEVWEGFISECFKAGNRCPLSSRAGSDKELLDKVTSFIDGLGPEPMSTYVNATVNGFLTARDVWGGILSDLYNPGLWNMTATAVDQMMNGNGTEALLRWMPGGGEEEAEQEEDEEEKRPGVEESSRSVIRANDRPSGPAAWSQGLDSLVEELTPFYQNNKSKRWFEGWQPDYYMLQQWPINKTHSFQVTKDVKTAFPLLILQNQFDPVTPLVGAQFASETFNSSRLVVADQYGHTAIGTNDCVDESVRAYLGNGTLPNNGTVCQSEVKYFTPQNETKGFMQLDDDMSDGNGESDDEGIPPI